ncbi:MAG TPA: NAD(P)/FAD-dependent oxidoreductase [Stellaceae bacterium]|jgi:L-2-hydroxyglutarate oxidase LhgO|nr:NAD(P)/FAD-dependent oxidoreductase [Stellaceae bacterium]
MTESVDTVVIGAGVVGLAVARALALAGHEVLVLEKERWIGSETSSRNSEVIHAGIYYPKDSLKALLCVSGKMKLYAYCAARGIPHRRLGKLIVACNEAEIAVVEGVRRRAEANGVEDLRWLGSSELKALEPALAAIGGYFSPSTGIIDSHALMLAYQADLETAGGMVVLRAPVLSARIEQQGFSLEIGGAEPMRLFCRRLVNSAGVHAPGLARRIEGLPPASIPRAWFCRGVYFTLSGRSPFRHLIYPVPEAAGLGVHLTLDLAGAARFGPDVEWIDAVDYTVDPRRGERFYAAIRTYWPALPDGALQPGYAGIRPKISGPTEPAADFRLQGPGEHGIAGLVNLYGIESPGLTASLAIAERVLALIDSPAQSAFPDRAAAG